MVQRNLGVINFNTSHVNVNLDAQGKKAQRLLNFNTSHVNVNLYQFIAFFLVSLISIHLMLMLIMIERGYDSIDIIFQYISC